MNIPVVTSGISFLQKVGDGQQPGAILETLTGHTDRVNCVKWLESDTGDRDEIVSGSVDKTAIVWRRTESKYEKQQVLSGHSGPITVLAACHVPGTGDQGRQLQTVLATASVDSTVRIWWRQDDHEFKESQCISYDSGFALDLATVVIPGTHSVMLACATDDHKVHVYIDEAKDNGRQFVPVMTLPGHEDWVRAVDFTIDDSGDILLASAAQDYMIRVWRFARRQEDTGRKIESVLDLPLDKDIQMRENTFSFTCSGESIVYAVSLETVLSGHENWIYSVKWKPKTVTVDGDWAEWNQWSQCSSTCTGGTRTRTRTCSDPLPRCGGLTCPGDNTEEQPCSDAPCCELTPFDQWTDCSQTCGNGTQSRSRSYLSAADALVCDEPLMETQTCNYGDCNMSCVMSAWTAWSPCSASCGQGVRSRTQDIIEPAPDCPDNSPEYQDCYARDCPCETNQLWSNTSLCQRTCEQRFEFNTSLCAEPHEGCVCEEGYFFDDTGNCVTTEECDVCLVNGTEYQPNEIFDHPDDNCYSCECVAGMEVCNRKCDIPTCNAGEELSYDVSNACCPICVPVEDTCQKYSKFEVVYDAVSDCITPQEVEVTYCAGGCGNSTTTSILMLAPNAESLASECSCCSGTVEEIVEVPVVCGPSQLTQIAYMAKIAECTCTPCISTGG